MITQLLRHVASSPSYADVKGNISRLTIYPPSLVGIVMEGGVNPPPPTPLGRRKTKKKPGPNRVQKGARLWELKSVVFA